MLERLGLRFADQGKEAEFRRYYLFKNLALDRASLFAAGCLFYAFFLWDRAIDPANWETAHSIRGLVVLPVLWAVGLLLGMRAAQDRYEIILTCLGVFCNVALSVIYCTLTQGFDFGSTGPCSFRCGCSRFSGSEYPTS